MRNLHPWPIFPPNLETPIIRSLSLQFLIQALIDAFSHLKEREEPKNDMQEAENLFHELQKMLLFSVENPFAQKGSLLDKLFFYTEVLIETSHIESKPILAALEQMRALILHTKSKMVVWKKGKSRYCVSEMLDEWRTLSSALTEKLRLFFSGLIPFLKEARSDENVLVFLIERRASLNQWMGDQFVENLFKSFFPSGHDQLRAVIYEGYTKRGFSTFLSTVEPLIEQIQWEVPCEYPTLT